MSLFDATRIPVLNKALDAYALRHKTISANIANIATPGYRAREVEFESELTSALRQTSIGVEQTDPRHFGGGNPMQGEMGKVVETPGGAGDASGVNNVDLDHEMVELATNQIRFKFSARLITDAFRGIQKSIRGTT